METLIILIGAIVILSVAFYMAREKSYLPPGDTVAEKPTVSREEVDIQPDGEPLNQDIFVREEEQEGTTGTSQLSQPVLRTESPTVVQPNREEERVVPTTESFEPPAAQNQITPANQPVAPRVDQPIAVPDQVTSPSLNNQFHTVQIGFFSVENNARRLAQEVERHGFQSFVISQNGNYKVQIGAYSTREQAERASQELKGLGYEVWVTQR